MNVEHIIEPYEAMIRKLTLERAQLLSELAELRQAQAAPVE